MFYTALTKQNIGITLKGDYNDLKRLYDVVHHCAECYKEESGAHNHLLSFAYEIRHAFQGSREKSVIEFDTVNGTDSSTYYHATFHLPYYLLSINLLKNSFSIERRLWQGVTILDLESDLSELALGSKSNQFYHACNYWVNNSLLTSPSYKLSSKSILAEGEQNPDLLELLADYMVIKHLDLSKKDRLDKFGEIFNYMHPYTNEYKAAVIELEEIAAKIGKKASEIGHLKIPEINKW